MNYRFQIKAFSGLNCIIVNADKKSSTESKNSGLLLSKIQVSTSDDSFNHIKSFCVRKINQIDR